MIGRIGVVLRKEVVDNLRDRRSWMAALAYSLFGPVLLVVVLNVVGQTTTAQLDQPVSLPVVGAEHAPALVEFLGQAEISILAGVADPQQAVSTGEVDVVLVIPAGFGREFTEGRPAAVRLIVDRSRQTSAGAVRRVSAALQDYSHRIGSLRLVARGISPSITSAIAVESVDVATPQSRAAMFLSMTPFFLLLSVFIGGMYIAIDTTVGERERGSLEPLFTNPLARREIILGKLGATLIFTFMAVLLTLLAFALVLNVIPVGQELGIETRLEWSAVGLILAISVPMMLLASALQIIVATFTKSYKEAQNYLMFLPLVPALPGMFTAFAPVRPELWAMLIPTFGQQLLMGQVLRGEALDPSNLAVSAVVTLAAGVVLTALAAHLYEREDVVFAR